MSQERFARKESGAGDDAAVIVQDVQQGWLPILFGKPVVRRSIVLPELTNLLGLPAANWLSFDHRLHGSQIVAEGEAADGGAVDLVLEAAQGF